MGFLLVWTSDLVSKANVDHEQLDHFWDRVVTRFLDHDLPGFAKDDVHEKKKKEQKATRPKSTASVSKTRAKTSKTIRADLPALAPEDYAKQTRLKRASSTRVEQEKRKLRAPSEKETVAAPPAVPSPRGTAVEQRVERTRKALDDIINRVTGGSF